jgi:hypothetical protein
VARANCLSQTDIMIDPGIDRSSTAGLTSRLVQRGWLQRRRTKHDRRIHRVRLTASGREALAKSESASQSAEQMLLQRLFPSTEGALFGGAQLDYMSFVFVSSYSVLLRECRHAEAGGRWLEQRAKQ